MRPSAFRIVPYKLCFHDAVLSATGTEFVPENEGWINGTKTYSCHCRAKTERGQYFFLVEMMDGGIARATMETLPTKRKKEKTVVREGE